MKRAPNALVFLSPFLAPFLAPLLVFWAGACTQDVPVDDKADNPGIIGPAGAIRGTVTYIGPGPCIRDGRIEGVAVVLLFDAANPPPPDGLATTAVNIATVPGESLFSAVARPTSGPGAVGSSESYCPPLDSAPITASADFAITQLSAGRYQVRGFYSRQNRFQPVFDFANLPLAGDVGGGVLVDPRASVPRFATITVGVDDAKVGLMIPPTGFVATGISMILGQVLVTGRPYFHVDYDGSRGFQNAKTPVAGEAGVPYPNDEPTRALLVFPQDHPLTSEPNVASADLFKIAQESFPSVHLRYGFPGKADDPNAPGGPDAWIAKNAKPADPFFADRMRPFYGIDPFLAVTRESTSFVMTRAFGPTGEPLILHDNPIIESFGFAQIFPLVVLAKLKDGPDGLPLDPPTPQIDPAVVVQAITLRNDNMTATSRIDGTGLASNGAKPTDEDLRPAFTAVIRPAALCIDPAKGLQGTLAAPYFLDVNPKNKGGVLLDPTLVLKYQPLVRDVVAGCLPPGYYSINVVYPTGQAWSLPNQTGACTYTLAGKLVESCVSDVASIDADQVSRGFGPRPLLASQQVTRPVGGGRLPVVLYIEPSERCMSKGSDGRTWTNHLVHEDKNANGVLDAGEDADGNRVLDLKIPDVCFKQKAFVSRPK